jgi:hypothetical protein
MLASCLMPISTGRRALNLISLACYAHQTWGERELLIADYHDQLRDVELPAGARRVARPEGPEAGPQLRALVREAAGEICLRWDDDDWQGPERVAGAVRVFEQRAEDAAAYVLSPWLDLASGEVLRSRSVFAGNGFAFRRQAWGRVTGGAGQDPFAFFGALAPIGGNERGAHLWGVLHGRNSVVSRARYAVWSEASAPAPPRELVALVRR